MHTCTHANETHKQNKYYREGCHANETHKQNKTNIIERRLSFKINKYYREKIVVQNNRLNDSLNILTCFIKFN